MALTLTNLQAFAQHALGGGDPAVIISSASATLADIVNQAGRLLTSMAPWHWREVNPGSAALTNGQAYTTLPSDFGELVAYGNNAAGVEFRLTTFDDLAWKRSQSGTAPSNIFWFTVVQPNAGAASAALEVPRVEWYPTPGATPPTLTYWYRAKWTELSSGTDVAKVPLFVEPLLVETVKAVARGREENTLAEQITNVMNSAVYALVSSQDARQRPDVVRAVVPEDTRAKS